MQPNSNALSYVKTIKLFFVLLISIITDCGAVDFGQRYA